MDMTFEELLTACSNGRLPTVEIERPVRNSVSKRGNVVTIKDGDGYKGCAVRFWDLSYNTWFYSDPNGTDRRSHYMRELKIIKS